MAIPASRICVHCGSSFPPRSAQQKYCASCKMIRKNIERARYRAKHREELRLAATSYYKSKAGVINAKVREKRKCDPERFAAYEKQKYERHKESRKSAATAWYWKNRDHVLALCKSDKSRKRARDRMRALMRDPVFKAYSNISRSIRSSLVDKARRPWEGIVGYSYTDLISHLERQFKPGMSWNNYGAWHIDHIRPRASFKFTSVADPQFKECWALQNLQPLWAQENLTKSDKWNGHRASMSA